VRARRSRQAHSVTNTRPAEPAATHTLTASRTGSGTGAVTSSPAAIDCGSTCTANLAAGTPVTLTATAASGSTFAGWTGGGCSGGEQLEMIKKRRFPIIGGGAGRWSFIHVDDAAAATVAAILRAAPGIYNVVDDEPAAVRDWIPYVACLIGARRPMRVPTAIAKLAAGPMVGFATEMQPVSNSKLKRDLGWQPHYASWRDGFSAMLEAGPPNRDEPEPPRPA
jgi:uncharacterized protein YbjT (DUF2867 family)